jgi:uncharacterized protein YfaS (alpha-2-macroglobulin family)
VREFRAVALILLSVFITSCLGGNQVSIEEINTSGELNNISAVEIKFSKDLAPTDQQGEWIKGEFLQFEPQISGMYKWTSANTLVFSPDHKLEPMREYTVKVSDKVLYNSELSSDFETQSFKTADFEVEQVEFFWTGIAGKSYTVSIQANIKFNYPVSPGMLKDYLFIGINGEKTSGYKIVSKDKSNLIAVNLGNLRQTEDTQSLKLIVKKGMKCVYAGNPLEDDMEFDYKLPPLAKLAITGIAAGHDGLSGWINIRVTQTVDEKKLKKYIKLSAGKDLNFTATDNSIRITGDFTGTKEIEVKVKKGMPGLFGGELEDDFEQIVSLVDLNPSIRFADGKGKYMMLGGQRNLKVNTVNIGEAEIVLQRIFKNNLLFFTTSNNSMYYNENNYYGTSYYASNYGKEIYRGKRKINNGKNWSEYFYVNPDSLLKEKSKGVYIIKVSSEEDRWISDSKIIVLSDLAVIAKKGDNDFTVFVNSIEHASNISGAKVKIISNNNQTILSGTSGEDGVVKFNETAKVFKEFTPRMILVEKGEDFNYVDLKETIIETSRYDVGGKYTFYGDIKAFIYSDRNLYRPGETAHIAAILRNEQLGIVKDMPIIAKVLTPRGNIYEEYKLKLNAEGMIDLAVSFPTYAMTGEYGFYLYNGSDKLIGTYRFNVEDFVPDKIRVILKNSKESYFSGETAKTNIFAEYLFGAKAANLKYTADIHYRHSPFRSKKFEKFDFSNSSIKDSRKDNQMMNGKLDKDGKSDLKFILPADLKSGGIIKCLSFISVFGPTGRPVNRVNEFQIFSKKHFVGIKSPGYYHGTDEYIKFKAVAVNHKDHAIKNFKAKVELVRMEWKTVIKNRWGSHYYYASERKEVPVWDRKMTFGSKPADISVRVSRSGMYKLKIYKQGEKDFQFVDFYAYSWSSGAAASFETDKEGRVEIVTDKKSYEPGEKAKILFTCPFAGKLLVTTERMGTFDYRYIDIDKSRSAEIELEIKDEFMPNVYISATLFKKHSVNRNVPFLVGHGYASIKVEKKSNILPLTIKAPKKIKPNRKVNITLTSLPEKNINVTLAVVDEGILQIKNFPTPDPYEYMYAKRALGVISYDIYKMLLPEIRLASSAPGGGYGKMKSELKKRTNPFAGKRFKLFAFWSGILKTDSKGKVTVPVTVPQFNGEARIMAVAVSGSRFGSADKYMKVADDIILAPQIPRFMTKGDSLIMPVTAMNTTSKSKKIKINLSVEGPLKVTSKKTQSITIAPNGSAKTTFAIKAENIGNAVINIKTSGAAKVKEKIDIGIRPNSPLISETGAGSIKSGNTKTLEIPDGFIKKTQHTNLTISRFPAVKFAKHLKYLVGYPHGCIEQTVSKLFPQLYFGDLAKAVASDLYRRRNPAYYIKEGIRKIESMQMYDGAMSYWQGGSYHSWWGSVYAAHFLTEASKAGYSVSKTVKKDLLKFLAQKAKDKSLYNYNWYRGGNLTITKIAKKEIIYSLYVLALAGKADISTMNYYKARPNLLPGDSKYLLAGAYALAGKWNAYYDILPKSFKPERSKRLTGGSFDSEIRANAIMLNVLLEVEPSNVQIPHIIRYLTKNAGKMYSTQERSFVFLALGKAAKNLDNSTTKVGIYADGKKIGTFSGKTLSLKDKKLNSDAKIKLKASGKGEVYYFWSREGLKYDGKIKEIDNEMKVRRIFYDYASGKKITNNKFAQGQLVVCEITLTGRNRSADNIAINDLIPAGFEIENPRLSDNNRLGTNNNMSTFKPDHMDIRDDRLILFGKLSASAERSYSYLLRAVNQGVFYLPPISADAMYDNEFRSVHGGGKCWIGE